MNQMEVDKLKEEVQAYKMYFTHQAHKLEEIMIQAMRYRTHPRGELDEMLEELRKVKDLGKDGVRVEG